MNIGGYVLIMQNGEVLADNGGDTPVIFDSLESAESARLEYEAEDVGVIDSSGTVNVIDIEWQIQ